MTFSTTSPSAPRHCRSDPAAALLRLPLPLPLPLPLLLPPPHKAKAEKGHKDSDSNESDEEDLKQYAEQGVGQGRGGELDT